MNYDIDAAIKTLDSLAAATSANDILNEITEVELELSDLELNRATLYDELNDLLDN